MGRLVPLEKRKSHNEIHPVRSTVDGKRSQALNANSTCVGVTLDSPLIVMGGACKTTGDPAGEVIIGPDRPLVPAQSNTFCPTPDRERRIASEGSLGSQGHLTSHKQTDKNQTLEITAHVSMLDTKVGWPRRAGISLHFSILARTPSGL